MTGDELEKFRKDVFRLARAKFHNISIQTCEDIASYAITELLKGRDPRTNKFYFVVEYLRDKEFPVGRKRHTGNDMWKRRGRVNELAADLNQEKTTMKLKEEDELMQLLGYCEALERSEMAIIMLKYKWGFKNKEIGELFGFDECRVSQIVNLIGKKIASGRKRGRQSKIIPENLEPDPSFTSIMKKKWDSRFKRKSTRQAQEMSLMPVDND